jgi:hypothetical protein
MTIEVKEVVTKTVTFELSESDAALLRKVLGFTYLSDQNQEQGKGLITLYNELHGAGISKSGSARVNLTNRGVRIYDAESEW